MRTGTRIFDVNTRRIVGAFFILFTVFRTSTISAQELPFDYQLVFDNLTVGIIRDVEYVDSVIYVAAENGFFMVSGGYAKKIPLPLDDEGGIISDLHFDGHSKIYVNKYGQGVFVYDLNSQQIHKFPSHNTKGSWKVAATKRHVIVSSVSSISIYDAVSGVRLQHVTSINDTRISGAYSISMLDSQLAYFSTDKHLHRVDLRHGTIDTKKVKSGDKFADGISLVKEIDGVLFIGTADNLFVGSFDEGFQLYDFHGSKPSYEISDVYKDRQGQVWVAAGELYKLEYDLNLLKKTSTLIPSVSHESFKTVSNIAQLDDGTLLVTSTQLGLVVFPQASQKIKILHDKQKYFHDEVSHVLKRSFANDIIVTQSRAFKLNRNNGLLSKIEEVQKADSNDYKRLFRCMQMGKYSARTEETRRLLNELCTHENAHITPYDIDKFVVYSQGNNPKYHIIDDGVVTDSINAPPHVVSTYVVSSGSLVALDSKNQLFIQMSRYKWKKVSEAQLNGSLINCVIETKSEVLWVCTEGNGIIEIDLNTYSFKRVSFGRLSLKFIRSALRDDDGDIWIASNRGLYIYYPKKDRIEGLGVSEGIFDTDFHYGGIFPSSTGLIIVGNRYSYSVDLDELKYELKNISQYVNPIHFMAIFEPTDLQNPHPLSMSYSSIENNLEIESQPIELKIVSTNYNRRHKQKLEYKLEGIYNEWKRVDKGFTAVRIPALETGSYKLKARAIEPNSPHQQPISTLTITIVPPFYKTWQAYLTLVLIISLALWLILKFSSGDLIERVKQRVRELKENGRYLANNQQSIRQLVENKQRLFTNISHEIKTPLSIVIGLSKQLKDAPHDTAECVETIIRNGERMERLVDQIAQVEKLDNSRKLPKKQYHLSSSVNAVIHCIKPLADKKSIELKVRVSGFQYGYMLSDTLEKVITNLVTNAIKYTTKNGRVRISVECTSENLTIRVKDNGAGMCDADKSSIFKRFTRLDEHSSESGSGIGLAFVNEIVKANSGWIDVHSEIDKGSTFTVTIPQPEGLAKDTDTELEDDHTPDNETTHHATTNRPRVLLVEDDREYRSYLYNSLSHHFCCFTAKHGKEAVDVIESIRPDIVVTDFEMQQMDGVTLARYIRTKSDRKALPVMLLTAYDQTDVCNKGWEALVDCIMSKSVSSADLVAQIESLLGVRALTQQYANTEKADEEHESIAEQMAPAYFKSEKDQTFFTQLQTVLTQHYSDEGFNRQAAAELLAISERHLNRKMSLLFEYNFTEYLKRFRILKAKVFLAEGRQITTTAFDVGFGSVSYFSTCFKSVEGESPKQFQSRHQQ